ncbi:hypothetical protein, partial [Bacillus sp. 7884-1]|uniref:hypothetical protein n=1 Tax=Bacillus sp. 7884-1 TaxID=2021693 RepID=UPI000BCD0344
SWPDTGRTAFKVAIYDNGPNNTPGKLLAGPFDATALRNGEWTVVDLASKGIVVNGTFYMVYIQVGAYPNTPGLGVDKSSPTASRSWNLI